MAKTTVRLAMLLLLIGVVAVAGATLLAHPPPRDLEQETDLAQGQQKDRFRPCPWPPCMAPCSFPPEPEVLCRTGNSVSVTSFTCCCCGGSQGTSFKRL